MKRKYQSAALSILLCSLVIPAAGQLNPLVIGEIPPEDSVIIYYDALIDNPLPAGTTSISNQGTVSGSNFSAFVTDDPTPGGNADETSIALLSSTLPVTLVHFSGTAAGEQVRLNWITVQEINSDKFIVEHSTDGIVFSEAGVVQARGHSNNTEHYSFVHTGALPGVNYYRLRQVDLDGQFALHGVVLVRIPVSGWQVLPNPVINKQLVIRFGTLPPEKYEISLVNTAGQVVFSTVAVYRTAGELTRLLLPQTLAPGVYYLRVQGSSSRQQKTLLIKN